MARDRSSIPGRGRPLGFDRGTATVAATAAFWKHGYEAASISILEEATGLSRSSITNTFGTKHELMLTCLDYYLDLVERELVNPLRDVAIDGVVALHQFFDRLETLKHTDPGRYGCLVVNSVTDFGDTRPDVSERIVRYQQMLQDGFCAALERARDARQLVPSIPSDAADVLVAITVAVNVAARSDHTGHAASRTTSAAHHLIISFQRRSVRQRGGTAAQPGADPPLASGDEAAETLPLTGRHLGASLPARRSGRQRG